MNGQKRFIGYYVTIICHQRENLFGEILDGKVILSEIGLIAERNWANIPERFSGIKLDEFIIMPNHLHGIIFINRVAEENHPNQKERTPRENSTGKFGEMTSGSLAAIVRLYKSTVTLHTRRLWKLDTSIIWQKNYYEHIIRDQQDLERIRWYIQENPIQWKNDQENLANH
jgi:putative transposase